MRLREIDHSTADDLLCEGLMDSIRQYVGDKVSDTVKVVNNTATAMTVIYKVASTPSYLETITFLLKKGIKQKIKALGVNAFTKPLMEGISRMFPKGRGIVDFIKALFMVAILNVIGMMATKVKEWVLGQVQDTVVEFIKTAAAKVLSLDSIVASMSNANGIFALLSALGIANEVLFEVLDYMNKKIVNAPGQATA